jgi:hypothetical protein
VAFLKRHRDLYDHLAEHHEHRGYNVAGYNDAIRDLVAFAHGTHASPIMRAIEYATELDRTIWKAAKAEQPPYRSQGKRLKDSELNPLQAGLEAVHAALSRVKPPDIDAMEAEMGEELHRARGLYRRAEALLQATADDQPTYQFKREGQIWVVRHGKEFGQFKDLVGMKYIAKLLACPNQLIPALELTGGENYDRRNALEETVGYEETHDDDGKFSYRTGFGRQDTLDAQAKIAYKKRLDDLDQEIEEAKRNRDIGRSDKLQKERQFQAASPPLASLAKHLKASVQTQDTSYAYRPDPPAPDWDL